MPFLAILAALALPAAAQVYKWVDEQGRTHYGEKPPEGVKATEMGATPSSPAAPTAPAAPAAQPDWKQKELESKRQRIERERKEGAESQQAKRRDAVRAQECAEAKRHLARLEEQIPVYQRNSAGERVYIEDKDRPAAIAAEKRLVAENCGP